jgi:hypothetical protein
MTAPKRIFAVLFFVAAASCIDPYIPDLKNYKSLLVVEGLITNENNSYKIKLCRTTRQEDAAPEMITDASVFVIDGDGEKTHLQNCGDGYYKTDSTLFTGAVGKKYILQILTSDEKEYRSEVCTMLPVTGIDKLYYENGEEISGNEGESFTGLKILLNSEEIQGMNQYFRWTYEEVWKIIMESPHRYEYVKINDTTFTFRSVPFLKDECWKNNQSVEIITNSIQPGEPNYINKQEINFVAPVKSDRLTMQYSILVKQYSVSKKEYDFWNNLRKVNEAGGDIFDSQPYTVASNIYNVNDTSEMVLGYFEVSAISQKRMYITAHELDPLNIPHYRTNCVEILKSPDDWPLSPPSWDEIYHMYIDPGNYVFVMPVVRDGTILEGTVYMSNLVKFIFAKNVCSLCEYTGTTEKPDFWVDLN